MKNFIIFAVIFLGLALNCIATEPFHIGRDNGMAILNSLADNISKTSNQTPNTTFIDPVNDTEETTAEDLWSWGQIPLGYVRNEYGVLVKLPSQEEWVPSI